MLFELASASNQPNWQKISVNLGSRGFQKTARQCMQRWSDHLNPRIIKTRWTPAESRKLFELHKTHGSQWKTISSEFPGRSHNYLKNQFFSLLRRSLRRMSKHLGIPKCNLHQRCCPSTTSSPRSCRTSSCSRGSNRARSGSTASASRSASSYSCSSSSGRRLSG